MAKLKKNDLNKVTYKSVQDFLTNFDKLDSLKDKLAYTTRYILQHGAKERDVSLALFVELARQKIAEASGKTKAPEGKEAPKYLVDKRVKNEKNDLAAEMFLSNPAEYIKNEANKAIKEIDEDEINFKWQDELKANCEKLIPNLDKNFNDNQFRLDKNSAYFGIKARTEAAVGGKDKLDELFNATKPSLFSRVFSTYSAKWSALEEAYMVFNNPNFNGFGDIENLEDKTNAYLKHKFPKWNQGEEIPAEAYSKLSNNELAKVNFSVNLLNAIKGQKEVEKNFQPLLEATKAKDIKYSDIPEDTHEVIDLDQLSFQNKLIEDTSIEQNLVDKSIDESSELIDDKSIEEDEPLSIN